MLQSYSWASCLISKYSQMTISGLWLHTQHLLIFWPIFSPHLSPVISDHLKDISELKLIIHCKTCFPMESSSSSVTLNVIPFIPSFRLKTFHPGLFSPFFPTSNLSIYADGSDSDPIITSTATALVHAITNLWFTAIAAFLNWSTFHFYPQFST